MTITISGNRRVEVEVRDLDTWTPGATIARIRQGHDDCCLEESDIRKMLKAIRAVRKAAALDEEKASKATA